VLSLNQCLLTSQQQLLTSQQQPPTSTTAAADIDNNLNAQSTTTRSVLICREVKAHKLLNMIRLESGRLNWTLNGP
jgi:hypothetical protein